MIEWKQLRKPQNTGTILPREIQEAYFTTEHAEYSENTGAIYPQNTQNNTKGKHRKNSSH